MTSCWKTRRRSCARYALETRGDVATLLVLLSVINIAAMVTKTRLDAPLLMTRALRAVRRLALAQKRYHIAFKAKRCGQAFLNGSISWASEEETALADENDRKEAAKLGSHGWAQLRLQRQVMLLQQVRAMLNSLLRRLRHLATSHIPDSRSHHNGETCEDINECDVWNACTCNNLIIHFSCACPTGFRSVAGEGNEMCEREVCGTAPPIVHLVATTHLSIGTLLFATCERH